MVKNHHFILALSLALYFIALANPTALAWSGTYHLGQEWAKIWINQDGSIDLFYNISITLDSGDNINYVTVGQPQQDFTIGPAADQYGNVLTTSDTSQGSQYQVRVNLNKPLTAGNTTWFTLTTNVAHMVYNDNQTNFGMLFKPTWWQVIIQDLRVSIVLPPNVTESMVTTTQVLWTSTSNEPDGRLAIFWEKQNWTPGEDYEVGVSFPKQYLPDYTPPGGGQPAVGINPLNFLPYVLIFFGIIFVVAIVAIGASKKRYFAPVLSMETLGIRHGLTAVEASYVLDMKPGKIVTEILYSLLKKRAIWVEATKPSVKLRTMPQFERNVKAHESNLRYYEIDFLGAIKPDGTLDEERLAETVIALRDNVEEKMRGYCRRDTIDYHKGVVTKAWQQVEQAGTSELASNAYDEQLLWLLLDPNVKSRTETMFHDRLFTPNPAWLWYWYGYQHYQPHPTYTPNIETPTQAAKPPTIPGADFANNIATSLEQTSNNIVVNIEKFANAIVAAPQPAKASHEPAHQNATCVCACHACACACACVSCACACAGGGVG
jgi:hypothetical protein